MFFARYSTVNVRSRGDRWTGVHDRMPARLIEQPVWRLAACLAIALTGSLGAHAAVFPVTPGATQDEPDAVRGNGVCLTAAGSCTLRAAIQEANAFAGSDRIEVPAGIYLLTLSGAGEDFAETGDLDITEAVDIVGDGPGQTIVDGNRLDRVFDIQGVPAVITGLTIRTGSATGTPFPGYLGGGVLVRSSSNLDLSNCELGANTANAGGGLFAQTASIATIADCRFHDNRAAALGFVTTDGSAVLSEGDVDLDRCEVSDNSAAAAGGALFSRGATALGVRNTTISGNQDNGLTSENADLDVVNSTLFDNTGIGLFVSSTGGHALTVRNSVLAGSGAGDCSIVGIAAADLDFPGEHNLAGDGTCPNDGGVVDFPNTDPALGALRLAGGNTRVHVPLVGSPLIDTGNDARCEPDDQRGANRPLDGDGQGAPSAVCDIGSVEVLPCIDNADEVVTAQMIAVPTEFVACFTVTAGPAVDVLTGGELTLRARNGIILANGFSVIDGSLSAVIDPAAGSGLSLP